MVEEEKSLENNEYKVFYSPNQKIGKGGNGDVFRVRQLFDKRDQTVFPYRCVIKICKYGCGSSGRDLERYNRFLSEIDFNLNKPKDEYGSFPCITGNMKADYPWFVMREGVALFNFLKNSTFETRLGVCLQLCKSIAALHRDGFEHRDIKPENILVFDGKPYLSDFGLLFDENDLESHITEEGEDLGPQGLRPPEGNGYVRGIDPIFGYKPFDVYLFAKTCWMILNGRFDNKCFLGRFNRFFVAELIDNEAPQGVSLEPFYEMLEAATAENAFMRPSIDKCCKLLEDQLELVKKDDTDLANAYKQKAVINNFQGRHKPDGTIYKNRSDISRFIADFRNTPLVVDLDNKNFDRQPFDSIDFRSDTVILNNVLCRIEFSPDYLTIESNEATLYGKSGSLFYNQLSEQISFNTIKIILKYSTDAKE